MSDDDPEAEKNVRQIVYYKTAPVICLMINRIQYIVDRIFQLQSTLQNTDEYSLNGKTVIFEFFCWNYTADQVSIHCFDSDDGVFILIRYNPGQEERFKTFGGEAWTCDSNNLCTNRRKAGLRDVKQIFDAMGEQRVMNVSMIFDGQIQVEKDTDLHLRFDHPTLDRILLITNALVCGNPLTVIDQLR